MSETGKMAPIYTTAGDVGAIIIFPYIFNTIGDWIGWVDEEQSVYSVHGYHVGTLTREPRIVRKREEGFGGPRRIPPSPPERIRAPDHFPLPPLMPELPTYMIDVLVEHPELLPSLDFGDLRDSIE